MTEEKKSNEVVEEQKSQVKRLYRSRKNKVIAGVCGGIGEYFSIDPILVRVLWILGALAVGCGVLAYIICWIIIPKKPE